MKEKIIELSKAYHHIMNHPETAAESAMPGNTYFLEDGSVLALPREDGDSRYPYGIDGFNFWTYASGYMHCNEGLFSPFLRASEGQEPKIAFFAGQEDHLFPLLAVPFSENDPEDIVRYTVFTKFCTYFITETEDMIFGIRTFVDDNKQIYFTLTVVNETGSEKRVKLSTYFNPFVKNALVENSTDRWFRKVSYIENEVLGSFLVEAYEEKDRASMTTNYGVLTRGIRDKKHLKELEVTTSRYGFVGGVRSSLHTSKALREGAISAPKTVASFTETAVCADIMTLDVLDSSRIDIRFNFTFEENQAETLVNDVIDYKDVESTLNDITHSGKEEGTTLDMHFACKNEVGKKLNLKEPVVNGFMEHLKNQVAFCSLIKGYIQLSSFSLIGIRDVFQALEGYLFWEPEKARHKMLEALDFLSPEGRLPRQYSLPVDDEKAPAMDLRPFIDQGVWVISAIATYLKHTKDYSILSEECGYYDIIDTHSHLVKRSDIKEDVLTHLIKIMNYLITNRDHEKTKCVLALYGDWNDALDGLGKSQNPDKEYGTGVSVMATLQVYQNLSEMSEILSYVGGYEDLIISYKEIQQEIKEGLLTYALTEDRILHGWGDEMSYLVGSHKDPDGVARDGLTSNAFWILSGLLSDQEEQEGVKSMILNAYKRLDSKYGLKTFEPHFEKGTYGVGRIPNLPQGTAENGATYIHASMFAVMSLFAIGESKKAWDEMAKLLPFTHDSISVSPFVVPNSYGYNEDLSIDGESMQDWQTGSSNVLLKTLIRYVYGYEPMWDGFCIQPATYQPFDEMNFDLLYKDKTIQISYKRKAVDSRQFVVNDKVIQGSKDNMMHMEKLYLKDDEIDQLGSIIRISIVDPKTSV